MSKKVDEFGKVWRAFHEIFLNVPAEIGSEQWSSTSNERMDLKN